MASKTEKKKPVKKKLSFKRPKYKVQEVIVDVIADNDQFIPEYHSDEAACCDLVACIKSISVPSQNYVIIPSRNIATIDTGIKIAIPAGFKAEIVARSSLAKKGLVIINAPGQIDSDFRGTIQVLVGNIGKEIIKLEHGERFAQIYLTPVYRIKWHKTDVLPASKRGAGGFGSTGQSG